MNQRLKHLVGGRFRRSALVVGAVVAAASLAGTPADAADLHCNGTLCAELVGANTTTFQIKEFTSAKFFGHFELQTPEHTTYNTHPDANYGVNAGHTFPVPAEAGKYCANQWQWTPFGYTKLGGICWSM